MPQKTKAQLARAMYNCTLDELTGGEKAAVTRAYNAQGSAPIRRTRAVASDVCEVEFGRPGVNGVKKCVVNRGTTIEEAFEQSGLTMNPDKEGFQVKKSTKYSVGQAMSPNDTVNDGDLYLIVPGVDSSR